MLSFKNFLLEYSDQVNTFFFKNKKQAGTKLNTISIYFIF